MTNEEAIAIIQNEYKYVDRDCDIERNCGKCDLAMLNKEPILEAYQRAIDALNQQPCDDAVSRQAVLDIDFKRIILTTAKPSEMIEQRVKALPSVNPKQKMGHWIDKNYWKGFNNGVRTEKFRESKRQISGTETIKRMVEPQESEDEE